MGAAAPWLPLPLSPAAKVKDATVAAAQGSVEGDPGLVAFERLFADYDLVVRAGKMLGLDEAGIIAKGRAATTKLWNEAKRLGHFPPEAEPATAD